MKNSREYRGSTLLLVVDAFSEKPVGFREILELSQLSEQVE